MSTNSIQTPVWGPVLWAYLHLWSLSFPETPTHTQRKAFATTLLGLFATLPCNICRDNIPTNLDALGFTKPHTPTRLAASPFFRSRATFTRFIFDLHNQISSMLKKPTHHLEYKCLMDDLELARAKACSASQDQHEGCVQPRYNACATKIYIINRPTPDIQGGAKKDPVVVEHNLNLDLHT